VTTNLALTSYHFLLWYSIRSWNDLEKKDHQGIDCGEFAHHQKGVKAGPNYMGEESAEASRSRAKASETPTQEGSEETEVASMVPWVHTLRKINQKRTSSTN